MRLWLAVGWLAMGSLGAEDAMGPVLPEEGFDTTGVPIPADCWPEYFGEGIEVDLCDPQGLLNSREKKEREQFLKYHADDSKIRLRVMLFKEDQSLPSHLDELVKPWVSTGEPTALLLYRMGEPERAEFWFSQDLAEELPITEVGRLVGQSARAAEEEVGQLDQFKEFCLQASIRFYWIERSLGWVEEAPETAPPVQPEAVKGASRAELIKEAFRGAWEVGGLPFLVGLSAFISFAVLRGVIRSRRRHRFPEFETESRLGGAHGAGVGAVISFGSTTQSPSDQKAPTVDCLGGI